VPQLPEGFDVNKFDVNDPDLYAKRLPRAEWKSLRRTAPCGGKRSRSTATVSTIRATGADAPRRRQGSLAEDKIFSSWENGAIIRFNENMDRERIEMQRVIMLNMDAPQHTRMRSIISRGFTPRAVGNLKTR